MKVTIFVLQILSLLNLCRCKTKLSKNPHFVTLYIDCVIKGSSEKLNAFSRGAILNVKLVLTSATQLYKCDPSKTNIVVELKPGVKPVSATKFKVHEMFDPSACGSNIALVLLSNTLELNDKVKQVAVLQKELFNVGEEANLTEWLDPSTNEWNNALAETRVKRVDFDNCKHDKVDYASECKDSMICIEGKFDANSKYSYGSPLVVDVYFLVGLGLQTDGHTRYGMLTNASFYYNWIKNAAVKLYCDCDLNIDVTTGMPEALDLLESQSSVVAKGSWRFPMPVA